MALVEVASVCKSSVGCWLVLYPQLSSTSVLQLRGRHWSKDREDTEAVFSLIAPSLTACVSMIILDNLDVYHLIEQKKESLSITKQGGLRFTLFNKNEDICWVLFYLKSLQRCKDIKFK
jgi:hypothetical protein